MFKLNITLPINEVKNYILLSPQNNFIKSQKLLYKSQKHVIIYLVREKRSFISKLF